MLRIAIGLGLAGLLLAGCAQQGREMRSVGSIFHPYCAPDGSVVMYQYSDLKGTYDHNESEPQECPWFKGPGDEHK